MTFDDFTLYGRDEEDEFGDSGAYSDSLEEDFEEEEEEEEEPTYVGTGNAWNRTRISRTFPHPHLPHRPVAEAAPNPRPRRKLRPKKSCEKASRQKRNRPRRSQAKKAAKKPAKKAKAKKAAKKPAKKKPPRRSRPRKKARSAVKSAGCPRGPPSSFMNAGPRSARSAVFCLCGAARAITKRPVRPSHRRRSTLPERRGRSSSAPLPTVLPGRSRLYNSRGPDAVMKTKRFLQISLSVCLLTLATLAQVPEAACHAQACRHRRIFRA